MCMEITLNVFNLLLLYLMIMEVIKMKNFRLQNKGLPTGKYVKLGYNNVVHSVKANPKLLIIPAWPFNRNFNIDI